MDVGFHRVEILLKGFREKKPLHFAMTGMLSDNFDHALQGSAQVVQVVFRLVGLDFLSAFGEGLPENIRKTKGV